MRPRVISPVENQRAREILMWRFIPVINNRGGVVLDASWMHTLMEARKRKLRDYPSVPCPGEASATMGAKLAELV
jgi:hypothetical protein